MPRYIRNDATGPIKIDPSQFPRDEQGNLKPISICACGLSQKFPICDGAHKGCRVSEEPGYVYHYDPATKQVIGKTRDEPGAGPTASAQG